MSIVQRLEAIVKNPPPSEDGEIYPIKTMPPVAPEIIARLEAQIGTSLSPECRELLCYCAGWEDGPLEVVDFLGGELNFDPIPGISGARMLEVATDGLANSWFYWKSARTPDLGPIYYYQHEVPMIIYQSNRMVDFVDECIRMSLPPYQSLIDDVHEFRTKPIKELNKDLIDRDVAIKKGDAALSAFAKSQPSGCWLYDFRKAKIGDGINLEALDVVGIHERLPILAIEKGRGGLARFFLGRRKVKAL